MSKNQQLGMKNASHLNKLNIYGQLKTKQQSAAEAEMQRQFGLSVEKLNGNTPNNRRDIMQPLTLEEFEKLTDDERYDFI